MGETRTARALDAGFQAAKDALEDGYFPGRIRGSHQVVLAELRTALGAVAKLPGEPETRLRGAVAAVMYRYGLGHAVTHRLAAELRGEADTYGVRELAGLYLDPDRVVCQCGAPVSALVDVTIHGDERARFACSACGGIIEAEPEGGWPFLDTRPGPEDPETPPPG